MSVGRRLALFVLAVTLLLAAASSPALAADRTSSTPASCAHSCGAGDTAASTRNNAPSSSCVHDPGCGGGASLSSSSSSPFAAVLAAPLLIAVVVAVRRFRVRHSVPATETSLADRLFRPPRLSFGR
jgi:hypothetical protein